MLTVDCGITAVEEVAHAKALGIEVVVTDHHRPGEELPDCPIVATRPSDYPFPELCGTGVVYKLGKALLGRDSELARHLDLVALATISDVVPLVDENRALAQARAARPGANTEARPAGADEDRPRRSRARRRGRRRLPAGPADQRFGPLCRPEAALELLLTEDADVAGGSPTSSRS